MGWKIGGVDKHTRHAVELGEGLKLLNSRSTAVLANEIFCDDRNVLSIVHLSCTI